MHFLDLTLPAAAANLALDEALLLDAEASRGGEVLRLWEWSELAVVVGAGGRIADDVDGAACRADGVPVVRRASGGGTVLLGPGCLLFSLVLSYERDAALREIPHSYRYILSTIGDVLRDLHPGIEFAGTSDLAAGGRKFSGNSQQRKRHYLLHPGTLLYDFPLDRIGRYLRQPARQPDYRRGRPHDEFVMNLPATGAVLKERLRAAWHADEALAKWPEAETYRLVREKYATPEWVRRR
jgi:lipoate-protein ligase A